jgi:hypothetical protein
MTKFYFLLISLYFLLVVYMSPAVNAPFLMALALTGASSKTTTLKINTPNRVSSCTMPVSISADYCTNAGFVKLTANSTGTVSSYLWSTGQSTQTILVDVANDYSVSLTNSSGCVGTAVISIGQELVINGNFTEGNTGFSSDYTYYPDVAGNNELVNDQGTNGYGVGTNGQNYHPGFWGIDHTNNQTGNKNFMLVNGHGNTLTIWKETVNVLPNTDYYFSAWAMSLNNVGPYARLQFEVNGVKVGTIDTLVAGPSTTSQAAANNYWTRFYSSPKWNSGSISGPIVLRIINNETSATGNDFGLDDISFATISPFISGPGVAGTDTQDVCPETAIQSITYKIGTGGSGPVVTGLPHGVNYTFDELTVNISGTPDTAGTYNYTVATSGCTIPLSASGLIVVKTPGTWTGAVDTDWNNANNWNCNVPTISTNVIISSGLSHYPTISVASTGYCRDITIQNGASLTLSGGTLQVAGAISNSETFDASNGTLEMSGSAAQTIAGSMFAQKTIKNLIVSNTGTGLTVSSAANDTLKITGALTFSNSSSTLNTGDNIDLVSDINATANVGVVNPGNTINGKVIVERYIPTGTIHGKSWQFLAAPANSETIKESWMEGGVTTTTPNGHGAWITGVTGTAGGFDAYSFAPAMKTYSPTKDSWVTVCDPVTTPLHNDNGYMIFVRGDRSVFNFSGANSTPDPTTLRTKGTLLTGTLPPINVPAGKYQSIGNPYASRIEFSKINTTNVDNVFYLWDPLLYGYYGYGGYQTLSGTNNYQPTAPNGGITANYQLGVSYPYIESGQAFFVHNSSGADGTLTIGENSKADGNRLVNRPGTVLNKRQFFRTYLYTNGNAIADGNAVVFDNNFINTIDGNDALKMKNSGENFGIRRSGKILSVEARSPVTSSDTIFYNIANFGRQTYRLHFAPENMHGSGLSAYLIDKYLKASTPVSLDDTSSATITINTNALSAAADRLMVVFTPMAPLQVTFIGISATRSSDKSINVNWKTENEKDLEVYAIERSGNGSNFNTLGKQEVTHNSDGSGAYFYEDRNPLVSENYYRIKALNRSGKVEYSPIVKVAHLKLPASISVYPNPVVGKKLIVQFNNIHAGYYNMELTNKLGQAIYREIFNVTSNRYVKTIILANATPSGNYQLSIYASDGSKTVEELFIK